LHRVAFHGRCRQALSPEPARTRCAVARSVGLILIAKFDHCEYTFGPEGISMTAEQILQEAIINLQKRDLCAETRRLVDEAAQLLADGRDLEARALVEKAQAISPEAPPKLNGATVMQTVLQRLSNRLAQEIANALGDAVEELSASLTGKIEAVSARVSSQEERIEALSALLRDLASKSLATAEQIDRQTLQLRMIQERQAQRAAALNAMLDNIARLREPHAAPEEATAA